MFAYAARMDLRCLIAGCGYTGLRLARRLQSGWRIMATARSAEAAARLAAEGVATLHFDLDAGSDAATDIGAHMAHFAKVHEGLSAPPTKFFARVRI